LHLATFSKETTHCEVFYNRRNLTKKSYKSACQNHDGTDHWYFGSIAQVTTAAVDLALADLKGGSLEKLLATV